MTRYYLITGALLISTLIEFPCYATVPELLPVQGILTDANNVQIDGPTDLRFALYDAKTGGIELWSVERPNFVVEFGYFIVYLGEENPLDVGTLLAASEIWLEITADGDVMDRIRLGSALFALEAQICRQVGDKTEGDIQQALSGSCAVGEYVDDIDPTTGVFTCSVPGTFSVTCADGYLLASSGGEWTCADGYATELYVEGEVSVLATELSDGDNTTTPVSFADLTGIPAGIGDGDDGISSITATAPLTGGGSTAEVTIGVKVDGMGDCDDANSVCAPGHTHPSTQITDFPGPCPNGTVLVSDGFLYHCSNDATDVSINGNLYSAAPQHVVVPLQSFIPYFGYQMWYFHYQPYSLMRLEAADSFNIFTTLPLPHNAMLTSVSCRIYDNTTTGGMTFSMERITNSSATGSQNIEYCETITLDSTEAPGYTVITLHPNTCATSRVDNDLSDGTLSIYNLRVYSDVDVDQNLRLHPCTATYTMPGP